MYSVCIVNSLSFICHRLQNAGRQYKVDGKLITIDYEVIAKFKEWSTKFFCNDVIYDFKLVQALLVLCVGTENIIAGNIPEKVLKFVEGNCD